MGINIKNAEAEAAIRRLASRTGEGLTEAITGAVAEKLRRLEGSGKSRTAEELLQSLKPLQEAIAAERKANGDGRSARELMDELYDEQGLPG